MGDTVIRVEKLSKKYVLSHQQEGHKYKVLRDIIANNAKSFVKTFQNPKSKIQNPTREEFWALKDVSFEIKQGDRVGIIGRNGAGKSTLLKILSRIVEPTHGSIQIKGRVASLLEVGTGFHPELSGRENIFLNGAILGMSKVEIQRKFDEIVDFAEIERFLDTPVKRYSSGMYVRLAFAVAAHLEPEILIVDEVLAVGDMQFQKKCLGKMQDVSKEDGRTVLFVSHNMDAIQRLCTRCLMLQQGELTADDQMSEVVFFYLSSSYDKSSPNRWIDLSNVRRSGLGWARFIAIQYSSLNEAVAFHPYSNGPLEFSLAIASDKVVSIENCAITIYDKSGTKLVNIDSCIFGQIFNLHQGLNLFRLRLESLYLKSGVYLLGLWLSSTTNSDALDYIETAFEIEVVNSEFDMFGMDSHGVVTSEIKLLEFTKALPDRVKEVIAGMSDP